MENKRFKKLKKINIIVYGTGSWLIRRIDVVRLFYNVIGITDKDISKDKVAERIGEKFIYPNEIKEYDYDKVFVASSFFDEIKLYLVDFLGIDERKIISGDVEYEKLIRESRISFGSKNPEKIFYVLRRSSYRIGLFANILYFLEYLMIAEKNDYFPVIDLKNYANIYLEESQFGKENSWEFYYEQLCEETLEEIYSSKKVILAEANLVKNIDGKYSYENIVKDSEVRLMYKKLYRKYIHINKKMKNYIDQEYEKLIKPLKNENKKICAVVYRGTDYIKLKPYNHFIQPTIEQLIDKTSELMKKWKFDYIYFDTEDENAFEKFIAAFPDKVIFTQKPRINEYPDRLVNISFLRENDAYLKGKEYLISRAIMAKCDYFISGINCGSLGTIIMNDEFKGEYIFNTGKYGFQDDSYNFTPDGKPIILARRG